MNKVSATSHPAREMRCAGVARSMFLSGDELLDAGSPAVSRAAISASRSFGQLDLADRQQSQQVFGLAFGQMHR